MESLPGSKKKRNSRRKTPTLQGPRACWGRESGSSKGPGCPKGSVSSRYSLAQLPPTKQYQKTPSITVHLPLSLDPKSAPTWVVSCFKGSSRSLLVFTGMINTFINPTTSYCCARTSPNLVRFSFSFPMISDTGTFEFVTLVLVVFRLDPRIFFFLFHFFF